MIVYNKKVRIIYLFLSLILITAGIGFGQEVKKDEKEKVNAVSSMEEVEGQVSAVSKQGIAVVYKKDTVKNTDYEIYLPIDKSLKLEHKKSLDQISVGDIVRVRYEELTEELKEGPKASRKAKVITFLKPAEKRPEVIDEESEGDGENSLPFKGIK